jgi:hypothetical protein
MDITFFLELKSNRLRRHSVTPNLKTSQSRSMALTASITPVFSFLFKISLTFSRFVVEALGLVENSPSTQPAPLSTTATQSELNLGKQNLGKHKASNLSEATEPVRSYKSCKTDLDIITDSMSSNEEPVFIVCWVA